jgi:hypothetical protein
MKQLSLTFEPGLAQKSRCLRDHMAARVYSRGLVETAGRMDLSPSKLTEKLAGADSGGKPRGMTIDELERYIDATGDVSPIYYLIDRFLQDPAVAQQEAMAQLATLMQTIPALLAAANLQPKRGGR